MSQQVIVALDVPSVREAAGLAGVIRASWYKVGLELIYSKDGLRFARQLKMAGVKLFLDAKLSDVPTTVERATAAICREIEPEFLSVRNNVEAALKGASGITRIAHVPYLTSDREQYCIATPAPALVCSAHLARNYRHDFGILDKTLIVPGIRLPGNISDDHAVPAASCEEADFLVIGRPITRADDPYAAYKKFLEIAA
ncbi:orotidine 5'-phosphate decarboxylase / HUMPS family protein [Hyphomicrobium sp.]|uniref:orotidine 5'-phosphate decarboxylase / HUMPS family protein n=1 Tax=Hyphomicrobium sp. TaxID=82 RepID=UPI001E0D96E2|nr:orotidine 5'-phosphate decarboxylase / HUMPS family protein [Hyphomicrobium sp.]MBY0559925.1 orotidine 5'-phosphate decarboxylase [Hyphomicrobium sp.]